MTTIELDRTRLLGFDRAPAREPGAPLAAPRLSKVGDTKDDQTDDTGDSIQSVVASLVSDPQRAASLCGALVEKLRPQLGAGVDLVVAPAIGGLVVGYEVGRQLGVPVVVLEREEGAYRLRPGLKVASGARCLVVDDTVRRGDALRACIAFTEAEGGKIVAAGCIFENERHDEVGVPLVSLFQDRAQLEALLVGRGSTDASAAA